MNATELLERAKVATRPTETPRYNMQQWKDVFLTLRGKHWTWEEIHAWMISEGMEVHQDWRAFAASACHVLKRSDKRMKGVTK